MTVHALSSLRRTLKEIGGMLFVAGLALSCVAAVNQSIERRLHTSATRVSQTTFAEDSLPIPEEPAPPAMVVITSPIDGVFQASDTGASPALVKVGATVKPETVLGSVQPEAATAMPILAGVTGKIKAILVEDQDLVMAGHALIKIEPTQMPKSPEELVASDGTLRAGW